MENCMLSRNAHKRNSRAHFQHVSWIFSLCTLNYRAKKRLRWSIYTIFLQRKNLVIDVKICMHQKIQIVPSVWALLKSQSETHANIWDLLCCTLLHLLRIANVCDLQSKHNTTVNMTKSVHVWKGIGRSINFGGFFPQFLISTESVIIRIHLGLIQICKSQILLNKF